MTQVHQPSLALRVDPNEMVRYVHDLMTTCTVVIGLIRQSPSRSVNGAVIRLRLAPLTCGGAR